MNEKVEVKHELVWGIDVSKNWLDISINEQVTRVDQTEEKILDFIKKNQIKDKQTLVILESTGGYERLAASCLVQSGFIVHVAHPNRVRDYAKAKGYLAKTDKLDAKVLEGYGWFIDPENIRELLTEKELILSEFSIRLAQLKDLSHQEHCRLGRVKNKKIKKSIERVLKVLEVQRESIELELLEMIKADEILNHKYELVRSMKGVGPVLGMTLVTQLPELGKATKKEIAALVGVAPVTKESGQYKGKARTQQGRASVRKVLYMAALVGARHNKKLKEFYERLVAKGKPKKVALVAVMRKMLVILNTMVQTNTPFKA